MFPFVVDKERKYVCPKRRAQIHVEAVTLITFSGHVLSFSVKQIMGFTRYGYLPSVNAHKKVK